METIKNAIAENFTGALGTVGSTNFSLEEVPDLSGKVAVLTGGTEGIGFGSLHTLLSKNIAKVYMTSRRQEKADEALKAIEEGLGAEARKKVVYFQDDQSDWTQTGKVASEIASQADRIDILICNAARGIMTYQPAPTNGYDLHFAVNHAGHEVIVSHLLPILKQTAEKGSTVRIVFMSSSLHASAPSGLEFKSKDDLKKDYGPNGQYGQAKLMNLLHSRYLDKHLHAEYPKILINAVHPGIVDTAQTNEHIHEPYPILGYGMSLAMKPVKKTQFEGCVSCMFAATVTSGSGQYIAPPCTVEKTSAQGEDMELAERLMKLTREVIQEQTKTDSSDKGCPFKDY